MSKFWETLIPAILASFLATHAGAVTISSNLGPGNTFQTGTVNSWATGDGSNSANAVAFVAPVGQNYVLDQILVADNWFEGTSPLNVGLFSGADPNTATLLESFSIPTSSTTQFASVLFTLTSSLHPELIGGNTYLIEETIGACGTASPCATTWGWQRNNQSPPQTGYFARFDGGLWFAEVNTTEVNTTPAYAVIATAVPEPASPVPEPASLILLGSALVGLGVMRRRRRAS